jgi:transketolase
MRLAAMTGLRVVYVFTHDSIGLGEDGPTHQPVEQIATLRMIPNMDVWRPCDTVETMVAWTSGVEKRTGPTALCLSRQNLPFVARDAATIEAIKRGGYVISEAKGTAKAVIIATGSEVDLALKAQAALAQEDIHVRVVSMPCTNTFDRQDAVYKESVLGKGLPRVAVEAGVTDGWWKYVGTEGKVIGLDRFGESAPAGVLFKEFGFTVANIVSTVESLL